MASALGLSSGLSACLSSGTASVPPSCCFRTECCLSFRELVGEWRPLSPTPAAKLPVAPWPCFSSQGCSRMCPSLFRSGPAHASEASRLQLSARSCPPWVPGQCPGLRGQVAPSKRDICVAVTLPKRVFLPWRHFSLGGSVGPAVPGALSPPGPAQPPAPSTLGFDVAHGQGRPSG